jgi:hypothetical protein
MFCILTVLLCGCNSPEVRFIANTEIMPSGKSLRNVLISAYLLPNQTPENENLDKYLNLPVKSFYNKYERTPLKLKFSGQFSSPEKIPVDFMKKTRYSNMWAENHMRVKRIDYLLFTIYEFEERIEDIVERQEVNDILRQSLNLIIEAVVGGIEAEFGEKYDMTAFYKYLRTDMTNMLMEVYQIYWEVIRSREEGETDKAIAEFQQRTLQLLQGYGLYLQLANTPEEKKENKKKLWNFLDNKLHESVIPKSDDIPKMSAKFFKVKENKIKLLFVIMKQIQDSFGTVEEFIKQLEIPIIFGSFSSGILPFTFSGNNLQPVLPEAHFKFFFKTKIPGTVVRTNGSLDLDGSVLWKFNGQDAMLTGYKMKIQSIEVHEDKVARLGLNNFPGSLITVERIHNVLAGIRGKSDKNTLKAIIEKCVAEGSLSPLKSASVPAGNSAATGHESMRKMFNILNSFIVPVNSTYSYKKTVTNKPSAQNRTGNKKDVAIKTSVKENGKKSLTKRGGPDKASTVNNQPDIMPELE